MRYYLVIPISSIEVQNLPLDEYVGIIAGDRYAQPHETLNATKIPSDSKSERRAPPSDTPKYGIPGTKPQTGGRFAVRYGG